jgi:hypothetical protein
VAAALPARNGRHVLAGGGSGLFAVGKGAPLRELDRSDYESLAEAGYANRRVGRDATHQQRVYFPRDVVAV